ncbi:putative Ig domain-containing protein [Mucilaginibacter sp. L3T2-6]|uniref:putative Ig domain-containing protein n=1 Tax=Mucilaginibacter sp. L3T2-6 TaxID=3062491 RepID=UPI0026753B4A|nr:putative Ig domain-containing protein [Mucilaginibacter sp. L3T2-6]MDO3640537.1 putative Ig domain-containing protein [Mucilaginibacter sp. L3T2-6]MDV6213124.1 putative Ig domain-containing protein [Mucilaginibacter sp. L3T2-6]
MKKLLLLICLAAAFIFNASAQEIAIDKGWKFSIGDSMDWAAPGFDDSNWKPIDLAHDWEAQGYKGVDGFGWYRLHLNIPSSLKQKSFLKDSLRLVLNDVDDNDEVYLNGQLIAKYGGQKGTIKDGNYGPRRYTIAANNPAIHWDKDNVLAIRIFDTGGAGGMYGNKFTLSMAGLMDPVVINTDAAFAFGENNSLSKTIKLMANSNYNYKGKLAFKVTDPENGSVLYQKINQVDFTAHKPFNYTFTIARLEKKSYVVSYTFTEEKSGESVTKTDGTPYILTPYPSAKPKINGADVYGARPGNPFLYLIPASGQKPLTYAADGLPEGLKLDAATGIISGVVSQAGDYPVTLTVKNSLGTKSKKLTIKIGDLIGLTPALGWNSWNAFGLSVNDERVRVAAKTMIEKLSAHGWNYINIDDGWEAEKRAENGQIVTNQKFPDMKATTDFVHSLGLKMGIYSSPGPRTCGGYLGSWQHEEQDAKSYGDWGIDYLKYDWCSYSEVTAKNPTLDDMKKPYQVMRAALNKVPRDIMFSFCQYGMGEVWKWGAEVGGNSWRSTGDITDTWESMSTIGFNQVADAPYAQPGHFNDPDMLVVGKVGWGDNQHNTRLTPDEQYTHISLWCLISSPLLIGCDMGKLDRFTLNLLTNDEVLAIDQDALGKGARQAAKTADYQIWVKEMADGGKAVGLFNTSDKYQTITLNRDDEDFKGLTKIRDVWQQKYIISSGSTYSAKVAPHGVMLVRLSR